MTETCQETTDFEVLWHAMPAPCVLIDADGEVATVNAAAEQFFSMSARALEGQDFSRFAPEGSRLSSLLIHAREMGVSLIERGVEIAQRDGHAVEVDLQAAPLNDLPNNPSVLLVIQPRSIAEKMDRSLAHRGAARSVSGMAAALAHEIKNPLAAISGAAQLLQDDATDEQRQLAELIDEETGRIRRLLDSMEHFTDSRPPERAPVNLHDALESTRRAARAGFGRDIRFVEEYDPSLPPTAGDRDQLARAFQNLVKNAAEAMDGKGEIVLRTAYRPGVRLKGGASGQRQSLPLEVSIVDSGPGIPEDLAPHIFEPFVTSKAGGVGLGLALVSKIVADHGGIIECESGSGRTVVRLLLPVWCGTEPADDT